MKRIMLLKETNRGISELSLDDVMFSEQRTIFFTDDVNPDSCIELTKQLLWLDSQNNDEIRLVINSCGGSVSDGLIVYDTIMSLKSPITCICAGMAASMAAILFASGNKGRRFILPHSKIMIHEPLIQGGIGGSASSIERTAVSILETKKILNEILAKHTGKTLKEINKSTGYDNFMNAEQAVKFGIADAIVKSISDLDTLDAEPVNDDNDIDF
ncbi:MAG: ClpP family protease [Oscillospiraceae bacterium]